jgi:hypothetical protein
MGFLRALLLLLWGGSAFATQYSPWFPPLWEFQSRTSYLFEHASRIESPEGSFPFSINDSSLHQSLELTVWPYWSVEGELYLTHSYNVSFGYEASFITLRYLLFDELSGDCFNLNAGLSCSYVGRRFLHNFNYPYHGNFNAELFASIGKEWPLCKTGFSRLWGMCAIGQANRGVPWMHGLMAWHVEPTERWGFGVWIDWLIGFGSKDITPEEPFPGYALIGHRNIDVGAFVECPLELLGTLTFFGSYNVYAHNFVIHEYAVGSVLKIPFSL